MQHSEDNTFNSNKTKHFTVWNSYKMAKTQNYHDIRFTVTIKHIILLLRSNNFLKSGTGN